MAGGHNGASVIDTVEIYSAEDTLHMEVFQLDRWEVLLRVTEVAKE